MKPVLPDGNCSYCLRDARITALSEVIALLSYPFRLSSIFLLDKGSILLMEDQI